MWALKDAVELLWFCNCLPGIHFLLLVVASSTWSFMLLDQVACVRDALEVVEVDFRMRDRL